MSQHALPITTTVGASFIVSFLAERMPREPRLRPTKNSFAYLAPLRFAGISITTTPGFFDSHK